MRCPASAAIVLAAAALLAAPAHAELSFVRELRADGTHVRELATPEKYLAAESPAPRGVANNFGFESLAFTPSGSRL